jgi:HAMP domain-containing protein
VTIADRPYFQRALATRRFAVGDYLVGRITQKAALNMGYPVIDTAGKVRAVLFAALDLAVLNSRAQHLELPEGATVAVWDSAGTILVRYPDPGHWVGRSLRGTPLERLMEGHLPEETVQTAEIDGVERVYGYVRANTGSGPYVLHVAVGVPVHVAFASSETQHRQYFIIMGALVLVMLGVAWVTSDVMVLAPLHHLIETARRLGSGDLRARAGQARMPGEFAALATAFDDMAEAVERARTSLIESYDQTIEGWSRALDLRDHATEGHTLRVTEITLRLAQVMGVPAGDLTPIRRGALLHDIGKVGIPDAILFKPGPLTDDEWAVMRKHPIYAYNLLSPIDYLRPALDIPYCHHEKWDGTGYPRGLRREQIPLAARIFAVVDVWDALLSDRPYRRSWSREKVLNYLREKAGTHFDPRVVEAFLKLAAEPDCGMPAP